MLMSAIAPDVAKVKTRLKQIWMAGDYDRCSRYMEGNARDFYERLDVAPGCRFLDVGCGSGKLALIAAKDGLKVTGVDIAGNLVGRARTRAQAEGLRARFEEADAEALPFEDASFDVVASLIGAMFAPRHELVAKELLRVCTPGGTIAMANWTPQGFIGQALKTVSNFIAPSGMPSPLLWGDETIVRERLDKGLSDLNIVRRHYTLSYPFPPSEVVEFSRLYYGPTNQSFAYLDAGGQERLRQELEALWSSHNRAGQDCTIVLAEYLEVIGIRT